MRRETWIGVATAGLVVATMAVDHLVGTEDDGDGGTFADPWVFLGFSLGLFWILTFLIFPAGRGERHAVQPMDLASMGSDSIYSGLFAICA